jgi:hypothetical protein
VSKGVLIFIRTLRTSITLVSLAFVFAISTGFAANILRTMKRPKPPVNPILATSPLWISRLQFPMS